MLFGWNRIKKPVLIISILLSVILSVLFLVRESPEYPDSGKWKNDELNIILDFDSGYGTLYHNEETIVLDIGTEPNSVNFSLSVNSRQNDASCSLKAYTVIFFGYYKGMEGNKISFQEKETDELVWFYLIEE